MIYIFQANAFILFYLPVTYFNLSCKCQCKKSVNSILVLASALQQFVKTFNNDPMYFLTVYAGCSSGPCQNDAMCMEANNTLNCLCAPGFEGDTCELGMDSRNSSALYKTFSLCLNLLYCAF